MENGNHDHDDNHGEAGPALIRRLVKTLPDTPGVYRMLGKGENVLYIGKARSLKKRVSSYTKPERLPRRLQRMVAETCDMVFVHTHTETEALLLESNLIKKLKPHYNILLRDDKSFPYILISGDHEFPLLTKHRGAQKRKGTYFGPFASGSAVNRTLEILQKAFMLRNCSDSYFSRRTRPCLQYHIKRCTAPCVGYVSQKDYAHQVQDARHFLSGRSAQIQERLARLMQDASAKQDYEKAALYRDRIRALSTIQARQDINVKGLGDADIIALYHEKGQSCVQVFFFRGGQNFGNRAYFPRHSSDEDEAAILGAFIAQFYEGRPVPPHILLSHDPAEKKLLSAALSEKSAGSPNVKINVPQQGIRRRLVDFALRNAGEALARAQVKKNSEEELLDNVADRLGLSARPQRIEVFDNSHISGTNMVGAMIVAGPEGLQKNAYRKFNIRQAGQSDDYGMMHEVLTRRFGHALKEGKGPGDSHWPDLLLIDGGAGQLSAAQHALEELGISPDSLPVVAIAKGPERNAGRERFFIPGRRPFTLPPDDPALYYLQRLRDEAHRFAISAHRARRARQISTSPLDHIPGIGAKRKKALLLHFGSAHDVARAGLKDLESVDGISRATAEKIYSHFHENG